MSLGTFSTGDTYKRYFLSVASNPFPHSTYASPRALGQVAAAPSISLSLLHTKGTFNLVTTYRLEESQIDRPHTWVHFEYTNPKPFKMNPRVWTVDL
jgi:hypothetical protein